MAGDRQNHSTPGNGQCYHARVPTFPEHRAKAITVINLKGGVGKTHTVWLLAGVCEERGKRVLVIDTDTQGNITRSLLLPGQSPIPGVEGLFDPRTETDPRTLIRRTKFAHIDILPSSAVLAAYDLSDQRLWEKSDLHLSLAEGLRPIRPTYDYLVFDCPPRLSLVSFAALCASDHVVIPLEAADWGAQGIVQVTAAVNQVRESQNPSLHLLGYLVSRFKRSRAYQRSYMAELRRHFGPLAFDTVIPDLAGYEKSVTHSVPITLHAPASNEASVARELFDEVERRIAEAGRSRSRESQPDLRVGAHAATI
jgi:chromosome partitioning protein